ncbi:MAG: hypothetical protein U5K84_12135 [Alkalibacterium sp.]|nr:hypothetical protein [Alkalibacterium sp.]
MEITNEMGAHEIVRPEKEMGDKVARNIMRNNILDVITLDDENSIIEITAPDRWIGRSLKELDLRKNTKFNVIGMKN